MARADVSPKRLARDFAVGAVVSVLVAWSVPDLGWEEQKVAMPTPVPLTPTTWRTTTLTSTKYILAVPFHRGGPDQPTVPENPAALALRLQRLTYDRWDHPLIDPAPGFVPHSWTNWTADYRGFPFRCLWSWRADPDFLNPNKRPLSSSLDLPGFVTVPGEVGYRLPLTPLWLGLIVDSVFWGGVFFFVKRIPGWVRARIEASRLARGLCPGCLYPLVEEAERCPECAREKTVSSRATDRGPARSVSSHRPDAS